MPASSMPASSMPASSMPASSMPASSMPASSMPASSMPASSMPASSMPVDKNVSHLSNVYTGISENILGPHLLNEETRIGARTRPNYKEMTAEQKDEARNIFKAKFAILKDSHKDWVIMNPPESFTLDQLHSLYEIYIKKIVARVNCSSWKIYLILMWLVVEIICIKGIGINASGYTKMQIASMKRYDIMLIQLGEKYHSSSDAQWPIEAKLLFMSLMQCAVFVGIKYAASCLGAESMVDGIQEKLESVFAGPTPTEKGPVDITGLPSVPAASASSAPADNLGGLGGLLSSFMGGGGAGGGDIASLLGNVGTMFTGNLSNNNNTKPAEKTSTGKKKYNFSAN